MLGAPLWREVSLLEAEGRLASRLLPTKVILPSCGDKGQYPPGRLAGVTHQEMFGQG